MTRPFKQLSISDLAEIAENTSEPAILRELENELGYRSSSAARTLSESISGGGSPILRNGSHKRGEPPETLDPTLNNGSPRRRPHHERRRFVYSPTFEQQEAIDAFMTSDVLKITAYAGAGKTSTLKFLANERAGTGLYLAFNKSIADEARDAFPDDVDCRTTHSLAFRYVTGKGNYSQSKLTQQLHSRQLAEALSLEPISLGAGLGFTAIQQAYLFSSTIRRFCQSGDERISIKHVPIIGRLRNLDEDDREDVKKWVAPRASEIWENMSSERGTLPMGYDGFLKLWSLDKPKLSAEYILLDEAQDTNPCVLSVLQEQDAQTVFVGDRQQQIYAWRGAMNAMATVKADSESYLTKSFRFGDAIAQPANEILSALGETKKLVGNERVTSQVHREGGCKTFLARTNASVIAAVLASLSDNKKTHIVGGTDELKRLVGDVFSLQDNKPPQHPDFFGFENWDQVTEFADSEEGEDLQPFVRLVSKHGPQALWKAVNGAKNTEEDAERIVSTAHKAKGREWESVQISNDFSNAKERYGFIPEEEARLFYVAITRAKKELSVSPELLKMYTKKHIVKSSSVDNTSSAVSKKRVYQPKKTKRRRFLGIF